MRTGRVRREKGVGMPAGKIANVPRGRLSGKGETIAHSGAVRVPNPTVRSFRDPLPPFSTMVVIPLAGELCRPKEK